jgi:hypothetical protein
MKNNKGSENDKRTSYTCVEISQGNSSQCIINIH